MYPLDMEYTYSQHGDSPSSSRQDRPAADSRTVPSSPLPPKHASSAPRIGSSRPARPTAAKAGHSHRRKTDHCGGDSRKDDVMKESKGQEGNIPPVTPQKGQRQPKAMMKLVSDNQAKRAASLAGSQSTVIDAELPSASLVSILTAAGSSPPTSPKQLSTSRLKLDQYSNNNPTFMSEGDGYKTRGEAKKRKSGSSKPKGQKKAAERTPSGDSDTQLASALFREIAPSDAEFHSLSPLKAVHSSQGMPDDQAVAYFEGLDLETQKQASQRSKREQEEESRRLPDIKQDGQRDREFLQALTLANSEITSMPDGPSVSSRKRLKPESEIDRSCICPFCSGDLPRDFADPEFHNLRYRLVAIASKSANPDYSFSRELEWSKRIDFCSWHEALMDVIPKGKAAGYPDEIDFLSIPKRLEEEWIRKELEGLAKYPVRSKKWQEYSKMIDQVGRSKWKIAQLREPHIVLSQHVGYYGVTGRAVIADHLRNLVKWGYFPTLSRKPGEISIYDPMTNEEFIEHILVPKAGTLLIMDDLGLGKGSRSTEEKAEIRARAEEIWKESREYGRWHFKESKRSERVEARVRKKRGEIKEMVASMREQSKRSRKKQMGSSRLIKREHTAPFTIDDSDDEEFEAVKRESIELKQSSPAKRSRDRMKTNHQPMTNNGDSSETINVVMLVDSTSHAQLDVSLSSTQRSLAKTESFNSGYGDEFFEGMDFEAIDDLSRAEVTAA